MMTRLSCDCLLLILFWFLACYTVLALTDSERPVIGDPDDYVGMVSIVDPLGLYLNTERTATCNGTISSLRFCYYGQRDIFQRTYRSLVAIYRQLNETTYVRTSETISITRKSNPYQTPLEDAFLPGFFNCDMQELTSGIEVQAGDIIGVCMYNSRDTNRIDMITIIPSAGYRMLFERASTANCDTGALAPVVGGHHLRRDTTARILHVSAEINAEMPTTSAVPDTPANIAAAGAGGLGKSEVVIIVAATVSGGVLLTSIVILIIVIVVSATCCFIVRSRKRGKINCDSRENGYAFISNTAYNRRKDEATVRQVYSETNPSARLSVPYYDYISRHSDEARQGADQESPHLVQGINASDGFNSESSTSYYYTNEVAN